MARLSSDTVGKILSTKSKLPRRLERPELGVSFVPRNVSTSFITSRPTLLVAGATKSSGSRGQNKRTQRAAFVFAIGRVLLRTTTRSGVVAAGRNAR